MRRVLERCELRPFTPADAPSLARLANDVSVWRNLRDAFPHPYTLEQGTAFIAHALERPAGCSLAVVVGGEAVGAIGLKLGTDVERVSAELGFWLGAPFRGRGVMSETIRAYSGDAFERFSLTRIFALPFAHNAASCRALERAGFLLEGTLRRSAIKDGQIIDLRLYARLAEAGVAGRDPIGSLHPPSRFAGLTSSHGRLPSVLAREIVMLWNHVLVTASRP